MEHKDLNAFKEALQKAVKSASMNRSMDEQNMHTLGHDIAEALMPALKSLVYSSKADVRREVMQELAASVNAREMPGVDTGAIIEAIYTAFGNIQMPQPKVNITSPKIDIPALRWPDGEMPIRGWVNLMGVNLENPLPVQLRDAKGRPVNLDVGAITMMGGGASGGKGDYFTIKGFSQSAYSEFTNADGRLRVSVETGGSGLTDAELRAAHLDVQQVSGAIDSVYVTGSSGTLAANIVDSTGVAYSGSNPVPVVFGSTATSASNIVDSSGVAYSGSNPVPTTIVSSSLATTAVQNLNGDGTYRDTFPVQGTVTVSGITASIQAAIVDSTGVQYSGSNPVPVTGTVVVSSVTASTASALVDSSGVQYSGSNPVPVSGSVSVSGSITSTVVTGPVVSDGVDDGSAPVKVGGIARTANPTAVAAGDTVSTSMDDLGRQVMRPVQVRDLIQTAYVQVSTGTETTLYASAASTFSDLIYIMGANNSDAAVSVDIRAGTANGVVMTLQIPASGTAGVSLSVPIPQDVAANTWTIDLPDITGTTVSVTALFSKEV